MLGDASEDLIVDIPSLVQVVDVLALTVSDAALLRLLEVPTKRLVEGNLTQSLGTLFSIETRQSKILDSVHLKNKANP